MFSFFRKEGDNPIATKDKVWKTEAAAKKGMLMMAMMRLQNQQPALIITFFENEQENLKQFMNDNQIAFQILDGSSSIDAMNQSQIYLVQEDYLHNSVVSGLLSKHVERLGKAVFFPGHYPIISHENKALTSLQTLGFEHFIFCLSFDDPMMGVFNVKNILPLLEKLGLEENEAIEHSMVSKSIENARKKLDQKVKQEKKAKSAEEWLALNMKS